MVKSNGQTNRSRISLLQHLDCHICQIILGSQPCTELLLCTEHKGGLRALSCLKNTLALLDPAVQQSCAFSFGTVLDTPVCQQCSKFNKPEDGIHLLSAISADEYQKGTFPIKYFYSLFPCLVFKSL